MKPELETHTTVVLSTAHLPDWMAETMEAQGEIPGLIYEKLSYGYRVFVGTEPDVDSVPGALVPAVWAAWGYGAKWLEFDCDAELVEGLPSWDW